MGRNISTEHFTTSPHRKQECRLVPEGKMVISCWWTCVYVLRAESLREIKLVNRRSISAKNPLKRTKEKSLCDWVLRAHSRGLDPPGGAGRVGQRRKRGTSCVPRTGSDRPVTPSSPLGSLTLWRAAGHDNRVGPVTLLAPPSLPRKGMWSELRENTFRNIQPLMRAAHPEWQAAAAPGSAQNQGQLGPLCVDCCLPAHGPWPPRYPSTTTHTHTHTHGLPTTCPPHTHPHTHTHTHMATPLPIHHTHTNTHTHTATPLPAHHTHTHTHTHTHSHPTTCPPYTHKHAYTQTQTHKAIPLPDHHTYMHAYIQTHTHTPPYTYIHTSPRFFPCLKSGASTFPLLNYL